MFDTVLAKKRTFQCFIFDARRKTFELGETIGLLVKTNKNNILGFLYSNNFEANLQNSSKIFLTLSKRVKIFFLFAKTFTSK